MTRKVARPDERAGVAEDEALASETPREAETSSSVEALRKDKLTAETEDHPLEMIDAVRRFSPAASARFAFRAGGYLAGRAADKLVSLYTSAFTLDRDYIADFNKSAALAHARHRRWDKAIPLLEKSLALAPDDLEVRVRLAEAYSAADQPEPARQQLEKILEMDPRSAVAVRALGVIHARRQDYDRAIECLEKAVRIDPDHAPTHYRLGMAYDNRKRYDQAVEAFKQAIRLDPRYAKAYQALGFTYESMGDRAAAVECFKKALELE